MSLLVLSALDVERVAWTITPHELCVLMAKVFSCLSSPAQTPPTTYTPLRTLIPTTNHTALFMPAHMFDKSLLGTTVKVVCVPQNAGDTNGLPASTIVLDETTSAAKAIVNARGLTALRNAAGSLLLTYLVKLPNPQSIVVFGAGRQIEAHLNLHFRAFPSIRTCTVIDRTINSRAMALQDSMQSWYPGIPFKCLASTPTGNSESREQIKEALLSTFLIICATSSISPLFPSSWVRTGTHVILVGSYTPSMHEVDRELIYRAIRAPSCDKTTQQLLLVDSRAACVREAGEIIDAQVPLVQMIEIGELVGVDESGNLTFADLSSPPSVVESASATLDNSGQPHLTDSELGPITMFKSVGLGLQDVAIACVVVEKAEKMMVGSLIAGYDG